MPSSHARYGVSEALSSSAPLADPTAVPNLKYEAKVDEMLRMVAMLLLDGSAGASDGTTSEGGRKLPSVSHTCETALVCLETYVIASSHAAPCAPQLRHRCAVAN